jgi:protein-tyrosine phosphatase
LGLAPSYHLPFVCVQNLLHELTTFNKQNVFPLIPPCHQRTANILLRKTPQARVLIYGTDADNGSATTKVASYLRSKDLSKFIAVVNGGYSEFASRYPFLLSDFKRSALDLKMIGSLQFYATEVVGCLLYIGSEDDARNTARLKRLGISHMINLCPPDEVPNYSVGEFKYRNFPMEKHVLASAETTLRSINAFLSETLEPPEDDENVFVGFDIDEQLEELRAQTEMPPLPAGWEAIETEDGIPYYYNSTTDETRWEHPGIAVDGDAIDDGNNDGDAESDRTPRVFLYCDSGDSRSVVVAIMFLVTSLGISVEDAYNRLLFARPTVYPDVELFRQLESIEKAANKRTTVRKVIREHLREKKSAIEVQTELNTRHNVALSAPIRDDAGNGATPPEDDNKASTLPLPKKRKSVRFAPEDETEQLKQQLAETEEQLASAQRDAASEQQMLSAQIKDMEAQISEMKQMYESLETQNDAVLERSASLQQVIDNTDDVNAEADQWKLAYNQAVKHLNQMDRKLSQGAAREQQLQAHVNELTQQLHKANLDLATQNTTAYTTPALESVQEDDNVDVASPPPSTSGLDSTIVAVGSVAVAAAAYFLGRHFK